MYKTKIITNVPLDPNGLTEIKSLIPDITIEVETTDKKLPAKLNPYFNALWGDFDWMRSLFTGSYDIKCFATSKTMLTKAGIVGHIGMYDLTDGDNTIDFYIGTVAKDKRATANGFKTTLAWLFVHEFLHGKEAFAKIKDRIHAMDEQGRLKELLAEHLERDKLVTKVSFLTKVLDGLLKKKPKVIQRQGLLPLVERAANRVITDMENLGHPVRIVEGFRSNERQAQLYAQGRTAPGKIVTNARPGESFHNYGCAVDFVFREKGYEASDALWKTLGTVGKRHGFAWGGDWKGFVDKPHLEMTLGYSLKDFQAGKVDYSRFN